MSRQVLLSPSLIAFPLKPIRRTSTTCLGGIYIAISKEKSPYIMLGAQRQKILTSSDPFNHGIHSTASASTILNISILLALTIIIFTLNVI